MAELATIARPYAEALIDAGADATVVAQVAAAAAAAADPALQQFAANPKATAEQVFDVLSAVAGSLQPQAANLLRTVIDNGRLVALPLIAEQAQALLNARSGVSQGVVFSAYPIDAAQLADVKAALEQRFGRRLDLQVQHDESLIGGIRAVVGDEVLDTSVKARLEKMKAALTA